MAKTKHTEVKEESFQEVANKYAHNSIGNMREELDNEEQRERIPSEGALSVEVRSDWYAPGTTDEENTKPTEYCILLGTGGPAARIVGKLDRYCQPETAVYEFQDWWKPWTAPNDLSDEEDATLLEYARQFWFGE